MLRMHGKARLGQVSTRGLRGRLGAGPRGRRAERWRAVVVLPAAALIPLAALAVPASARQEAPAPVSAVPGELQATSSGVLRPPALGEMSATSAVSPTDVWAVGGYPSGGSYLPLATHWDGHAWRQVPTPAPEGTSRSYLLTVSALSSDDVWAAGAEVLSDGVTMRTLTEHWDGRRWKVVKSPSVDGDWNMLNGLDAVSPDDVWVVGDGGRGTTIRTLVEHWDGRRWTIVPSPNVEGMQADQLNHVAAVSADDVWAVGYSAILNTQYSTLAEHWNGRKWRIVKTPDLHDPNFDLQDVSAVGTDDVWATGSYWSDDEERFDTLAEHWNGDRWVVVPSPNPKSGSISNFPLAVSAVSSGDVWSSGWYELPGGDEVPLMEHWNGHRWRLSQTPDVPNTPYSNLIGLAGVSSGDVWAVGSFYYGGQWCSLYEHWNGRRWTIVR